MTTRMQFRPATLDEICRAVPVDGSGDRPNEIHRRLGKWSLITVRHAMRLLTAEGRVTFEGPDCQRRYRRIGSALQSTGGEKP